MALAMVFRCVYHLGAGPPARQVLISWHCGSKFNCKFIIFGVKKPTSADFRNIFNLVESGVKFLEHSRKGLGS